jgi:two-component system LytT family response regulator
MPGQLTALIVDDEIHNRIVLEKMLQQHTPAINAIYQADTVKQAIQLIGEYQPQIVFLDIQMKGETGFDLLQQIGDYSFEVIFVTAHDNYAIKAFRFNAVDYLLKPVVVNELKEAIEKAIKKLASRSGNYRDNINRVYQQMYNNKGLTDSITIATSEGFLVLQIRDIVYCQASNNYTIIHLKDKKKIISSQTLGYYEELLADRTFFRTHRSYLINLPHVISYIKGEGGYIIMANGDEVELTRNHKTDFMNLFKGQ